MSRPEHERRASPVAGLEGRFRAVVERTAAGERWLRLPLAGVDGAASTLVELGARFAGLFVAEVPERSLVALFAHRGELVALRAPVGEGERAYASLSLAVPACCLAERELHDRHGLVPLGHPDLRPLVRPDADAFARRVEGPEAFVIPYGPIRSGVFETLQYVVETGGEDVLALDVRPLFKRRALEERFAGLPLEHGAALAERVAGIASVAHSLAFAQAVERALGVEPPLRAQLWRAVHAELERIANHLEVAARLAEDCALAVGLARFAILKEDVLRLRARLCGSRFGRGVVVPGGVAQEPVERAWLAPALDRLEAALGRDRRLLLGTTSFTDRLIGTGRLDRATVERLAGVGPVARAAGASTDARYERPYGAYDRLGFDVVTVEEGDAMARLEVRFGEVAESLHVLRQALDRLERAGGAFRSPVPEGEGAALGWAEAPMGELVYWVAVAGGRIEATRASSPSLRNWPLLQASFRGDVLTDFSFIEHSFGLTAAGADR